MSTFPCYRCGTHNSVGSRACGTCQSPFYYNCPHCGAWVDNTFVNCPQCRRDLSWPADSQTTTVLDPTRISHAGYSHRGRSAWPLLLSLLGAVVLIVIPVSMAASNSLSSRTGGSQAAGKVGSSLPVHTSQLYSPSPSTTPTPASTSTGTQYTVSADGGSADSSSSPTTLNSTLYIGPGSYNPGADSYLRSIYPNWGVCTGGSCGKTQ